jgi:hypothetical protein
VTLYYVAHRLFAAHDRAVGAYIAGKLAHEAGPGHVFLPFCDTDEENLTSACKGRTLFELDCARLRRITGMIAVLHGPSLDDGVCMEIGFAAAMGAPVVLVTTDFQTYASAPDTSGLVFPEPLLEHLAASVVRTHRLGPLVRCPEDDPYRVFFSQNLTPIRAAAGEAVGTLLSIASEQPLAPRAERRQGNLAYIEPSPHLTDPMWDRVAAALRARGRQVYIAQRFSVGADVIRTVREDWAAAMAATLAVIDARGPETPPGAALVTGAFAATRRPVLAAHSGTWQTLADGREPNWRNLMIQYAITGRFSSVAEFAVALDALLCMPT